MTVVLDDHLLRDWLIRRDEPLLHEIGDDPVATTNLWYARLCKSAAGETSGALAGSWSTVERGALKATLVALSRDVIITPMRQLAWTMGELIARHQGLSMLGAEAVAAAVDLGGRLLVSARDDGPGTRRCCGELGVRYRALAR